jgi:hypothetical protein
MATMARAATSTSNHQRRARSRTSLTR